jgi:DNA primase
MNSEGNKLLSIIAKDYSLIRKGNYYTTEEHDSLVINPKLGLFYWNSKGVYGDVLRWLTEIKGKTISEAIREIDETPEDFNFSAYEVQPETPNSVLVDIYFNYGLKYTSYWHDKRGYTDDTISKFRLGYTGKYWVIPIYVDMVFANFQCRGIDGNGNKIVRNYYQGIGNLPFNFGILKSMEKSEPLFITESPVDAIMLAQNGLKAISCTAGASSWDHEWSKQLLDFEQIYICYDNDEAGRQGSLRTSSYLNHNSFILSWPEIGWPEKYDMTDLYKDGMTMEDISSLFVPAHVLKSNKTYKYNLRRR